MNKNVPLSIVVASYNHSEYIIPALKSLLNQSFTDFELIIVDDASTDDSVDKIKTLLTDSRIKLITLDVNRGVCNACNIAINNSNGRYIKFFASDDVALPNLL